MSPPGTRSADSAKQGKPPARPARAGPARQPDELVDMAQAIRLLKTSRPTFYRWVRQGKIKGHKLGRQWRFYRRDIERFLRGQEPRIDLPADIGPLMETLVRRIEQADGSIAGTPEADKVARTVHLLIRLAAALRASDIHIEPQFKPDGGQAAIVRCRLDGVLHQIAEIDLRLLPAVVEQFKRMGACDVHEKHRPQDCRIILGPAEGLDRTIDLRVCFAPAVIGEAVTVRVLDRDAVVLSLDRIDYAARDRQVILEAVHAPSGLIIVTGPAGCGKTTVIYACLNHLARPALKVMTIEDPVEFMLPGVTHMQLNERAGLTFATAIRAMLRSDPDIMMVGEIRDSAALNVCLQASLTGHVVFSTLHADEAPQALVRMVEIGAPAFVIADATRLVLSQRLVRKLCPACSVAQKSGQFLDRAEAAAREGGLDWDSLNKGFREPVGCEQCARTGYRGRTVIAEALPVSPAIGQALRRGASAEELCRVAVAEGMRTMAADGIGRAAEGVTSLAEVFRVLSVGKTAGRG